MTIEVYEQMSLPHSPKWGGQQEASERSGQWNGSPKTDDPAWPARRSGFGSARQISLGQLAADAVMLQRLLADAYPELARIQRLEG